MKTHAYRKLLCAIMSEDLLKAARRGDVLKRGCCSDMQWHRHRDYYWPCSNESLEFGGECEFQPRTVLYRNETERWVCRLNGRDYEQLLYLLFYEQAMLKMLQAQLGSQCLTFPSPKGLFK